MPGEVLDVGRTHRTIHHTPWEVRLNPQDRRPEFLPPPDPDNVHPPGSDTDHDTFDRRLEGVAGATSSARFADAAHGYEERMKLMRSAAMIAIGKKLYDEGRKPENQRRIKEGIERLRAKKAAGGRRAR